MKKTYKIEVDCANCASKMERAVGKIDGVTAVTVSFLTQKMTIETDRDSLDGILPLAVKACKKVEPDCEVYIQ